MLDSDISKTWKYISYKRLLSNLVNYICNIVDYQTPVVISYMTHQDRN